MVDALTMKQLVYTFQNERPNVHREGSWVDTNGLLQGNASLHLANVTVADEGLYCCRVIVTRTSRPVISLPATATEGEKETLVCDITGFDPAEITVTWLIQNVSQVSRGVCTGMATANPDGTYSVRSLIRVQAAAAGGVVVYVCRVTHRSYPGYHSRGVWLTTRAPKEPGFDAITLIAVSSVVSVLLVFAVIGGVLLFYRYIHTVPPTVSDISQSSIVYALKPTDLRCTIKNVRRISELKVKWFKTLANGDCASAYNSQSEALLSREDLSDQANTSSEGTLHVSTLTICVSVKEDMTKYQCVVQYGGKRIIRETPVSVQVNPTFLQISSIPQIPKVKTLLVLCCRVEKFYPGYVELEWTRNDGEQVRSITNYGPFSDHESMYSMWSKIELVMAEVDENAVYTCRVYHSSFPLPGYRDVLYHINTRGTPPSVMFIKSEPPFPRLSTRSTSASRTSALNR
ncbi:hypothetical protein DPEC_G00195980 [Dallia pectoralis]|uniref:Uncharacterized protein n=1 Tax=Dallia pectoralis TaxID=75939 RepID=A0ACC2G7H6_DALPE|nr:hypothetical protein DPEC_G00195980 [Dallia pectoralis]